MDKYRIVGGTPLSGEVEISGAKNAAVAILPAAMMCDGVCRIENIPNISDVAHLIQIMYQLGVNIKMINKSTIEVDARHITCLLYTSRCV